MNSPVDATQPPISRMSMPRVSISRLTTPGKKGKHPTRQILNLIWRVVTFSAAMLYIVVSFRSGIAALEVLHGAIDTKMDFAPYDSPIIQTFLGPTTIRTSRLVDFLNGTTTPRDETMYLESTDNVAFDKCNGVDTFNPWLYSNENLRDVWADLTRDVAFNVTLLSETELILPVVDCLSTSIAYADDTVARVFYLVRKVQDPDDVYVATLSFSMQDYLIDDEHQRGSAGIAVIAFVNDVSLKKVEYHYAIRLGYPYQEGFFEPYQMKGTSAKGFWILESVPRNATKTATKVLQTASRTGFFIDADSAQCNIKNLHWEQPQDAIESISVWRWAGNTELRDSWAWVHGIHFFFAADTLFNALVLLCVVYQNLKKRKFWIGDAFVSTSSTIELRGLLVLVTWYVNGFWRLIEFCFSDANAMGDAQGIYVDPNIICADLMTLYMCLADLLGRLLQERVDPALVVLVFQGGFQYRRKIAMWIPAINRVAFEYATNDYMKGMTTVLDKYTTVSPMRLWTTHPLEGTTLRFILAVLFSTFLSFSIIIVFAVFKKLFIRVFPPAQVVWSKVTDQSKSKGEADGQSSFKSSFTVFEIATGAPLQHRVGLASDYNNCIYIKGMKFASPDGIYCNGYVIVDGKFLVATADLLALGIILLTRVRFKNIFVYEVHGHTVQQTARLVYPETMSLKDLVKVNINILS